MKRHQHTTPVEANTTPTQVVQWAQALTHLHARIAARFARPEPRHRALKYLQGILSSIERKNGWWQRLSMSEGTQEGLLLARQMEHRNRIGVSLVNLGATATEQGNYAQAEVYLQEVLEIARQIGRHWLLCGALHAKGDLDLKLQRFDEAASIFQEIKSITSDGNQEYQAIAYYGLARVARGQGDMRKARELGQESLHLLETIGNRLAPAVRSWLDEVEPGFLQK